MGMSIYARLLNSTSSARKHMFQLWRILHELFRNFPTDSIRAVVLGVASLGCQVLAFSVVFTYVSALESNRPLLEQDPRNSTVLFAGVALASLILFLGFTLLEYRSRAATLSLCRRYQDQQTRTALSLASQLPHWFAEDSPQHISTQRLRQIFSTDIHQRTRIAWLLMLSLIPIARLLLCTVILFTISWQFSLFILFAVGVPVLGLFGIGKRIADTITSREYSSHSIFEEQRDILERSWQTGKPLSAGEIPQTGTLGEDDSRYQLYFRRMQEKARGSLLINAAKMLGIMMLILLMGWWLLRAPQDNWSLWLTYLITLRYFLNSLGGVSLLAIRASRFSRQSMRFEGFLRAARLALESDQPMTRPCPEDVVRAYQKQNFNPYDDVGLEDED